MQQRKNRLVGLVRSGFTLIEVMISIAISTVLVAALYTLFTAQSRQFIFQDMQMEMHQNLRFGADMLTRSIRLAGYGSGGYVTGVMGASSSDDELPVIMSWDSDGSNETDAITVVYMDPGLVVDTKNSEVETCDTETISVRPAMLDYAEKLASYTDGDLMICFDYADLGGFESYMWTLDGDADTSSGEIGVVENSGYSDYDSICGSSENLTPIMTCSKGQVLTFYIDDVDDGTGPGSAEHPVLMLDMDMDWPESDDVPLVDNIEDLQIEYCVDDGTDTIDCSDSDNWTNSIETDEADSVWMVRVTMVVRSSREELGDRYKSTVLDIANHSWSSTVDEDGYYRQVLSTEITVRNMRAQVVL